MRRAKPRPPARQAALALVARRLLSRAEVQTRLARRGYTSGEIDDAVGLLEEYGYLDEAAVIDAVRREALRAGRGPHWVKLALERRGIDEARAESAADHEERAAGIRAAALLEGRFGALGELAPVDRGRARRFLFNRGFSVDSIQALLGEDP